MTLYEMYKEKKLPPKLQTYLDEQKEDVIHCLNFDDEEITFS